MKIFKKFCLSIGALFIGLISFAGCGKDNDAVNYNKLLSDFTAWMNKTFTQQNQKSKDYKHPYAVKDILDSQVKNKSLGLLKSLPNKSDKNDNLVYHNLKITATQPTEKVRLTFSKSYKKDKDGNPIPDYVNFKFMISINIDPATVPSYQEYFNNPNDPVIYLDFVWSGQSYKSGNDPFDLNLIKFQNEGDKESKEARAINYKAPS